MNSMQEVRRFLGSNIGCLLAVYLTKNTRIHLDIILSCGGSDTVCTVYSVRTHNLGTNGYVVSAETMWWGKGNRSIVNTIVGL